ncbi:hypothetical protein VTL71DRAFT_177 [Oculimacula yallundae]|uniref:GH16 domain-containing protein n=1 Tax=Oculimacula yallundae TaxID=86028 RepID=A0ABR4CZC0_9HELO
MADINVTSQAEAKAHIAKIRHDKGLWDGKPSGPNVSDLENALTTLSDQLYQSSTHFLLEIIQNADDNTYADGVHPSLHFTYKKGGLRIDCNEVGFSPRNVEALCRVGQGTKKGEAKAKGYVGEKGIGFKSVFKAADNVWVSSGHYSFKFDESQPLGMIAPIWDEFPAPTQSGVTSMYLKLSNDYNVPGLLRELRALDSRLLIFLRRLRSISVTVTESLISFFKSSSSRNDVRKDLIRLTENDNHCDYIIKRHRVLGMPQDKRREGITSSEIVLGFPITSDGRKSHPRRESQQVYAFLPIRDYGFEFLIQADFLLIASREDIDSSAEWNIVLRNELTSAFIDSMKEFNSGELRYLWSQWLPIRDPLESFLKPFHRQLIEQMKTSTLLYAQNGDLLAPSQLSYVLDEYLYDGAPLTVSSSTSTRYLSGRYLNDHIRYLEVIGVARMTEATFYEELVAMVQNSAEEFGRKPNAWHSYLASVLTRMSPGYSCRLPYLDIVPLSNGTWVHAQGQFILFPASKDEFALPGGLDLKVVESEAAADPSRRNLFKLMGVGELEKAPVLEHVKSLHSSGAVSRADISREALVSQIEFLFTEQYLNPSCQRFWFTAESGKRLHGSQLYQHSTRPHSATQYLAKGKFQFIHNDYLAVGRNGRGAWSAWLEERMHVATIPRLVELTTDGGFKLSEDFEFIIKTHRSSEVMVLLRVHWHEYCRFFDPSQAKRWSEDPSMRMYVPSQYLLSVTRLRQKLGAMLVRCKDGKMHRLDTTYLPCRELLVASHDVPFVEILDPDDAAWKLFEVLGLSIRVDIHFYLRSLEKLSKSTSDNALYVFASLIDTIQYRCSDPVEAAAVKNYFFPGDKICIPTADGCYHEWIRLTHCRWNGPRLPAARSESSEKDIDTKTSHSPLNSPTYRFFRPLSEIYPGNKQLFWHVLGVRDSSFRDLVDEAKLFRAGDSLAHISAIFKTISQMMEEDESKYFRLYIKKDLEKAFPVSKNWKIENDVVTEIKSMDKSCEWFIADTAILRTTFAGVVPLLDIRVDDLLSMSTLLEELDLSSRFLRGQSHSVAKTNGNVRLDEQLTELFRTKVDFIIRLIPTRKTHRAKRREVIKQLRNLEVYIADEVVQHWCVWHKKKWVYGPAGSGVVALAGEKDILKIYLAAKGGADANQLPSELVDEMFNFCGMQQDQPLHSEVCLHIALSQHDRALLARSFSNKGIPSLESLDFADAEDAPKDESVPSDIKAFGSKAKSGWKEWKGKIVQTEHPPPKLTVASAGIKKPKRKFRIFGTEHSAGKAAGITIAAILLSPVLIPAGVIYGVSNAMMDKNLFDNRNNGGYAGPKADTTREAKQRANMKSKVSKPEVFVEDKTGPGGMEKFQASVSKGMTRLEQVVFASACNEDIAFRGELAVHDALNETLGQSYNATQHWTSKRRVRAGLPAFSSVGPDTHATFRFPDTGGAFTQFLAQNEFPEAQNWTTRPPRYHIDVKSCTGDLRADFVITPVEFQRAKEFSVMVQQMKGNENSIPTDVYILARVYDIVAKSKQAKNSKGKEKAVYNVVFLVDPWEYYHADRLLLKHEDLFSFAAHILNALDSLSLSATNMRPPKALSMVLLLLLALVVTHVLAYCQCGYRALINTNLAVAGSKAVENVHELRAVDSATSYIFTDLLETDFFHLDDIAKNTDWQRQNYSITAASNRGKYGMEFNTADIKLNRIKDSMNWTGPGEFGGDPGLQLTVDSNMTPARFTLCAQLNSVREDMLVGTFRALLKLPSVPGTCSAFFWYHNDSQEIDMEFLSSQFNRNTNEFLVNLVHQTPQSAAQGFSVVGKDYQIARLPVDPTSEFHEYRIDCLPGKILFYMDGKAIGVMNSTSSNQPGHLILTQWSNGDTGWSGGPPLTPASLTVGYVKAYFNSSNPVRQADAERRCSDPSESDAICDIEDYTPPTNVNFLVNDMPVPALNSPFFYNRPNMTANQTVYRSDASAGCVLGLVAIYSLLVHAVMILVCQLLPIGIFDGVHENEADEENVHWPRNRY